jgi:hypothetical protein
MRPPFGAVTLGHMRTAYKALGHTIAGLVVVQAAAIAFAFFGLLNWVGNDKHDLTPSMVNDESAKFTGSAGFVIHSIGADVIALLALVLLIVSFFAKIPGGVKWAGFVFLAVLLQWVFAFISFSAPVVGLLHGGNAIAIAWFGWHAASVAGSTVGEPESAQALSTR